MPNSSVQRRQKFVQTRSNGVQHGETERESYTGLNEKNHHETARLMLSWVAVECGRHFGWAVPILVALAEGENGAGYGVYFDAAIATVLLWLVCNPFYSLRKIVAPAGRFMMVAAIVSAWGALRLTWLDAQCRLSLVLAALVLVAVAMMSRKTMVTASAIRQSAEVNRASGLVTGKGSSEALDSWERFGQQETRALLRQTLGMIVDEDQMQTLCRAVYILAYLHGEKKMRGEAETAKAEAKRAEFNRSEYYQDYMDALESAHQLRQELTEAGHRIDALESQVRAANIRAADAEGRIDSLGLADVPKNGKDEKKWAVYAHWQQSQSMEVTAKQYGISKGSVKNYVDWCKAQEEAIA